VQRERESKRYRKTESVKFVLKLKHEQLVIFAHNLKENSGAK